MLAFLFDLPGNVTPTGAFYHMRCQVAPAEPALMVEAFTTEVTVNSFMVFGLGMNTRLPGTNGGPHAVRGSGKHPFPPRPPGPTRASP